MKSTKDQKTALYSAVTFVSKTQKGEKSKAVKVSERTGVQKQVFNIAEFTK